MIFWGILLPTGEETEDEELKEFTEVSKTNTRAVQHPGVSSVFRSSKSDMCSALEWKKHQGNPYLKGARK